ncbi:MAG: universal stress protein [Candidatus Acidiferrum sp.]|jgi:nucleotide-binding universal stress UspA family protein
MLATKPEKETKQRVGFENILFATDFMPAAKAAMPYAMGLAKSFEANLYAIHVTEPINYALPPEMWVGMQTAVETEKKHLREELRRNFPEGTLRIIEAEGDVATALATVIEKYEIDLIVLGTRGCTGFEKVLLGSKAEEILRRAPCPVLTVGPDVPATLGTRGKIASILYATHFGHASVKAARIAVSLAEEYQGKLTALTVLPPDRNDKQGGLKEEIAEACEEELRGLVPEDAELWCTPHFMVEYGNQPADKILHRAHEVGADLIILGAHKPQGASGAATHLPTSTIHQVIAHANCPVLTVRG